MIKGNSLRKAPEQSLETPQQEDKARIIEVYPSPEMSPERQKQQSTMMQNTQQFGSPQHLMRTFQQKNGNSARGVQAFFAQAPSPLMEERTNADLKNSATNKVLSQERSLQKTSTEGIHSVQKQNLNFKTQSNSSMISETDYHMTQHSGVYMGNEFSPMKVNKSGDKVKYSSLQRPQEVSVNYQLQVRQQKNTGQKFSISITRKQQEEKEMGNQQSFMPQPVQASTQDKQNEKDRMASTQQTLATAQNSNMLELNNYTETDSRVNETVIRNKQSYNHGTYHLNTSSLSSSVQFDKIRYQNLSKLSAIKGHEASGGVDVKRKQTRNVMSLPRNTEHDYNQSAQMMAFSNSTSSQMNQLLGLSNSMATGGTLSKNKMAQTGIVSRDTTNGYLNAHKSLSPIPTKTTTDFKCRYQELTWNQRPAGAVPTPLTVGLQLNKNKKSRKATTKRSIEKQNQQMARTRTTDVSVITTAGKSNGQQSIRIAPDPYNKRKMMRSPNYKNNVQFPSISKVHGTPGANPLKANHRVNTVSVRKQLTFDNSNDQLSRHKDSIFASSAVQSKDQIRDGQSQDISTSRYQVKTFDANKAKQSYVLTTEASTLQSHRQSVTFGTSQRATKAQIHSQNVSTRQMMPVAGANQSDEHSTAPPSIKLRKEEDPDLARTFEVILDQEKGRSSIFFNQEHAYKAQMQEFEKTYGARKARLYRNGASLEVHQTRTLDQQRKQLHPQLRDLIQKQYSSQVREALPLVQQQRKSIMHNNTTKSKSQTTSWKVSKTHSKLPKQQESVSNLNLPTNRSYIEAHDKILKSPPKTQHVKNNPIIKTQDPILIERSISSSRGDPSIQEQSHQSESIMGSARSRLKAVTQIQLSNHGTNMNITEGQQAASGTTESLAEGQEVAKSMMPLKTATLDDLDEPATIKVQSEHNRDQMQAFETFKKLGGTFYRQAERQVITMDNGMLNYEQKNALNNTTHMLQIDKVFAEDQDCQPWNEPYKENVIRVVKKGILSNKPKPKKVIRPPTPEPEINRLLHREVCTIKQLLSHFSEKEQIDFRNELVNFSMQTNPSRYLVDKIDTLDHHSKDPYHVHLGQVYKFLFKKQIELVHSKKRMTSFKLDDMHSHRERFIKKAYDAIVALMREEIVRINVEREVEARGEESRDLALLEAEKSLSMTRIKEIKVSQAKRVAKDKDKRVVDYIKYLIGQTTNQDYTLNREEFRQTNELHTKSLVLPFDEYAAKEDNAMKKVANDILEKVEMNVVIQEATMPIAALKYANDPKFIYFMKIKEQMSLALPLLAKVVNKQLSLYNYALGMAHCTAFAETCLHNNEFMSKLVLNNNGLTDDSLAALLKGLLQMTTISVLDLRKNQVGSKSVFLMADFFLRNNPRHLQVLRIVECKMDHPSTLMLLRLLQQKSSLRTLALVSASFDDRNEKELVQYLKYNSTLKELDLSWNQMSQNAYIGILQSIVENNNMLMLNLSHNVLIQDPKGFQNQNTAEAKAIKADKMATFNLRAETDKILNKQLQQLNRPVSTRLSQRSSRGAGSQQSQRGGKKTPMLNVDAAYSQDLGSRLNLSANSGQQSRQSHQSVVKNENQNLLQLDIKRIDSAKSFRSEGSRRFVQEINEKKALKLLEANKHVQSSAQGNQLISTLLIQVMKENRKLQHIDLTSTNLPSQVIIHLCNRLRKSRSILSMHLTDNPGLSNKDLEETISAMLKCKPKEPHVKINVNRQTDFALNSNMVERLTKQLEAEKADEPADESIARNTIRFRQIMQQKRIEQKAIDFPKDPEYRKLILNRMIGFKEQMPGSGQWKLLSENNDECWHCDQWVYSLVFWDAETIAKNAKKSTHHKVLNQMVKKIEQLNPDIVRDDSMVSLSLYDDDQSDDSFESLLEVSSPGVSPSRMNETSQDAGSQLIRGRKSPFKIKKKESKRKQPETHFNIDEDDPRDYPELFGSFTNWKPQKMMKLEDFVLLLTKKYGRQNQEMYQDFQVIINIMKKQLSGMHRSRTRFCSSIDLMGMDSPTAPNDNVRCFEDLNERQQQVYNAIVRSRQKKVLNDWRIIIEQYLEYRKPFLVDAYQLNKPMYSGRCPDLYVLPCFIPAGKHTYLVRNQQKMEYSMHTTLTDFRTEDPPILIKEIKTRYVERVFRKENSVFDPWKEDSEMTIQICAENDFNYCKLNKIVKDPFDFNEICDFLMDRYDKLKLMFLQYACGSSYPFITQTSFEVFCEQFEIIDSTFKMSSMHVCFAAANQKPKQGQHKMGLCRAEFVEILARMAVIKYHQTKVVKKPVQAVEKLVDEVLLADWKITPQWQEFRSRYLWTLDVNDVFATNIFGLQKLYNRNQTIHKTWLEYSEAHYIFTTETLLVNEYTFKVCYGFCKMTIENEQQNASQHNRLTFVEFLELIGRVAAAYWDHNKEHLAEVQLPQKIEFILDQMLPLVGIKRNEVNVHVESESCTDEDY